LQQNNKNKEIYKGKGIAVRTYEGLLIPPSLISGYGLEGPGIESLWGRDFLHLSRPALRTGSFPGV
jgi:hypothetical protein